MSKILNIRLPASATTTQFNPADFNQLKEAINQIVFQLNNSYTPVTSENTQAARLWSAAGAGSAGGGFAGGIRGFQVSNGVMLPYGLFMSDQDQTNAGATSENLITFDTPVLEHNIRVESSTRLYFDYPGEYLVTVSCQVVNKSNAVREFELWAKNAGVNYPLSNTRFDLPVRKSTGIWGHIVANISGVFTVNDPTTEYLEMAWWGETADVQLESYVARTSPTRPAIPSVILTASFISAPAV